MSAEQLHAAGRRRWTRGRARVRVSGWRSQSRRISSRLRSAISHSRRSGRAPAFTREPSVVERRAREFADIEKMIDAAESMRRAVSLGPLRRAGAAAVVSVRRHGEPAPDVRDADRPGRRSSRSSSLIAHELAHSWSGNLVTNATWRDFWLNGRVHHLLRESHRWRLVCGPERAAMLRALGRGIWIDKLGGAEG